MMVDANRPEHSKQIVLNDVEELRCNHFLQDMDGRWSWPVHVEHLDAFGDSEGEKRWYRIHLHNGEFVLWLQGEELRVLILESSELVLTALTDYAEAVLLDDDITESDGQPRTLCFVA